MMMNMIPTLSPIYCSGRLIFSEECKLLEERVAGNLTERVCIHLKKPGRSSIGIYERNKPLTAVANFSRNGIDNTDEIPHRVVGTTKYNKIRVCTKLSRKLRSRPKPYSSIGFKDKLKLMPKSGGKYYETYKTYSNSYNVLDLKDIFISDGCERESAPIRCVIQQRKRCKLLGGDFRFQKGSADTNKRFTGLSNCPPETNEEILELIRTRLPTELRMNVLKYLNYDHVSWLADNDERFARDLAFSRYNIESHDKSKFPNLSALLPAVRREAAKEMRFSLNEDMWLVSFSETKSPGVARRFAIKPGIYRWRTASSITSMKFDPTRSCCDVCTDILARLQKSMALNQRETILGNSQVKVFCLEGSEGIDIDTRFASPHYRGSNIRGTNCDYSVHMWVEDLDNKWLQDVHISQNGLKLEEYRMFAEYKTLVFKDPVKFFGTTKVIDIVDEGILALTSEKNGEVLGYLVDDEEFRLRLPLNEQDQRHITGLNFFPPALYIETRTANELVRHIRFHEVETRINDAEERLRNLREALLQPLNNAVDIQPSIDGIVAYIQSLTRIKYSHYQLNTIHIIEERIDENTVHFHEIYQEGFDFCTKFGFNRLGGAATPDSMKRNINLIHNRCSYERLGRKNCCTLKIIDPVGLKSTLAVEVARSTF